MSTLIIFHNTNGNNNVNRSKNTFYITIPASIGDLLLILAPFHVAGGCGSHQSGVSAPSNPNLK